MSDVEAPETTVTLVEVMEDEDGEVGWAQGHIEPALMTLSAVANRMQLCGAEEAMGMFVGGPTRYVDGVVEWSHDQQVKRANDMLASVRHVWLVEDKDNEEMMHNANEGDPGAEPYTRIDLPW